MLQVSDDDFYSDFLSVEIIAFRSNVSKYPGFAYHLSGTSFRGVRLYDCMTEVTFDMLAKLNKLDMSDMSDSLRVA